MAYQITCIIKRPSHEDPHRRIQYIGGKFDDGKPWRDPEELAISHVKTDPNHYVVREGGRTVKVIVKKHEGRDYLKTETDHFLPDNLLSLPDCQ